MFGHPEGTTCEGYRFFVENDYNFGGIAIHAVQINYQGNKTQVAKVYWEEQEAYEVCQPALRCREDAGQALFDSLWAYGYRPRETVLPDALVAAKNEHIGDLRKVVTKLLEFTTGDPCQ